MNNFKARLAQFMSGRYGIDQLYHGMLVVYLILILANTFIRSAILDLLVWTMLFWMFFRVFSKNIYKRQLENTKFLKLMNPIKVKASVTMRRLKEINTHRFRKCPYCQRMLRLPRKIGKHTVECPCCHNEFKLRIWW